MTTDQNFWEITGIVVSIILMLFGGGSVVIWYFIKRTLVKSDKKADLMLQKIDGLQNSMHDYAMALEIIKSEHNNTKENIGELKADMKHVWNRFESHNSDIEKIRKNILALEIERKNCPARKEFDK